MLATGMAQGMDRPRAPGTNCGTRHLGLDCTACQLAGCYPRGMERGCEDSALDRAGAAGRRVSGPRRDDARSIAIRGVADECSAATVVSAVSWRRRGRSSDRRDRAWGDADSATTGADGSVRHHGGDDKCDDTSRVTR